MSLPPVWRAKTWAIVALAGVVNAGVSCTALLLGHMRAGLVASLASMAAMVLLYTLDPRVDRRP